MLDLDKYINAKTVDFKLGGRVLHVKMPSARLTMEISRLETEAEEAGKTDNSQVQIETQCKVLRMILNNNTDGIELTETEIEDIPVKVQLLIAEKIGRMKMELENDPN